MTRAIALAFTLLPTVALLLGCGASGPRTYPVSGTVTFEGTPIDKGSILFLPSEGPGRPEGGEIVDGRYSFEATAGKKRVQVHATRAIPGTHNPMLGGPDREEFLPPEYDAKSTLTAEVVADQANTIDFPLKARAGSKPVGPRRDLPK